MSIYFSEYFNILPKKLVEYGAYDISVITDLPLFVDPFLLFNSDKVEYQSLHNNIIDYLIFLRDKSLIQTIDRGLLRAWYTFPEVKQNWLGFTKNGNGGSGLGMKFARNLNSSLNFIFEDFGEEVITQSGHLEKLCLFDSGVGKDNISDFTVNLIKEFLLEYTETFAINNIDKSRLLKKRVPKVKFNYETESWQSGTYFLPHINGEYIILTPKDILTMDNTFLNSSDMYNRMDLIIDSLDNEILRSQLNNYLKIELTDGLNKKERIKIYSRLAKKYPEVIDYYIREKEASKKNATSISEDKVLFSEFAYFDNVREWANILSKQPINNKDDSDSYEEAYERIMYLKDVIENKDGYRIFYIDGEVIKRERDLQIMYTLTHNKIKSDINAEVNNGRGPADFVASNGSIDKTIIEFKLAKNNKLKQSLLKQVEIYKKANNTEKSIWVIIYYTEAEFNRVNVILKELSLFGDKDIILIDARNDNKPSGSIA
jgi:hypothetical protein